MVETNWMDTAGDVDMMVGANLTRLRGDMSMDDLVDAMRKRGNKWSKTTLFNVEHGTRQLKIKEAVDILDCLGRDPVGDLPLLLRNPAESMFWNTYNSLKDSLRNFQGSQERLTKAQERMGAMLITHSDGGKPLMSEAFSRELRISGFKLLRQSIQVSDPRGQLSSEERLLRAIFGESSSDSGSIVDQALHDDAYADVNDDDGDGDADKALENRIETFVKKVKEASGEDEA